MVNNMCRWALFAIVWTSSVYGQSSIPTTAVELERKLFLYQWNVIAPVNPDGQYVPAKDRGDTIRARLLKDLKSLQGKSSHGSLEQEALAWLNLSSGQVDVAQQYLKNRLVEPKLSVGERAHVLKTAVQKFSGFDNPGALSIAKTYMAQLNSLPPGIAASDVYQAHTALAEAYYAAGKSKEAVSEYERAFSSLRQVPFVYRNLVYNDNIIVHYAIAVSGYPDGRTRIDSIASYLTSLMRPSQELITQDSAYIGLGNIYSQDIVYYLGQVRYLGTSAPSVSATHWLNSSEPRVPSSELAGSRLLPLTDGKIRLLEFGEFTCAACVAALPIMDSLRSKVPSSVEVWYVTHTKGTWGVKICEPEEEVEYLRDFYVNQRKLNLPIALWAGPREATEDGGSMPRESPNTKAYAITTTPTFVLIDGKGRVRHLEIGLTREGYDRIVQRINYLVRESKD